MEILKNLKKTDWIMIISACLIIVVIIAVYFGYNKKIYKTPVLAEKYIQFSVFFRGITITDTVSPFKVKENAFITIRNVPYTKLKIVAMDGRPRMAILPANNKEGYVITQDVSVPNLFDFIVKLEDTAKKTPDGYVAGGNKIKMGIPVVIEGEKYKYTGVISNVYEAAEQ